MGLPAYSRGRSHPAPSLRLLVILIVPAQSGGPAAVAVRVAQPAFGLFLVDPGVGPCRGTCAVQRHQEERAPGHGSGKSIEWDGDPVAVIIDQYGGWAVDARDCEVSFLASRMSCSPGRMPLRHWMQEACRGGRIRQQPTWGRAQLQRGCGRGMGTAGCSID